MKIKRATYKRNEFYPLLLVEFEEPGLPDALFGIDNFVWFWRGFDVVHVDWPAEWERTLAMEIGGRRLTGLTDNKELVDLVKKFRADLSNGEFAEGKNVTP